MPLTDERALLEMLDILAEVRDIEGGALKFTYDFDDYKDRMPTSKQKAILKHLERENLLECRFIEKQKVRVGLHSRMPVADQIPAAVVSLKAQELDSLRHDLEAKYRPIVLRLHYDPQEITVKASDHILGTIKLRDDTKVAIFEVLYRNPNKVVTRKELREQKSWIREHVDMSGKFNQMPEYKHVLKRFLPISGAMKMKLVLEIAVDREGYKEISGALNPPKTAK